MTDRELLELAAKAAYITAVRSRLDDPGCKDMLITNSPRNPAQKYGPWNPLTDDGDALRLAVECRMDLSLYFSSDDNPAYAVADGVEEPHGGKFGCKHAATRRAIVRAAAEIGRGIAQPIGSDLPEDNYYKTQAEAEEIGRAAAEIGKTL